MGLDENSDDLIKPKANKQQRNFGCPCGKTYLSYPALFTHVKQKHGGKAPGDLIKPKSEKARGRPRISSISNDSQAEESFFNAQEQLSRTLSQANLSKNYEFNPSEGKKSCNDMMTNFKQSFDLSEDEKKTLYGFISYIKLMVHDRYGKDHWDSESPSDIIDISNQIVRALPDHREEFPVERKILVDLIYILFKWMYRNKWTDHKLIRRTSQVTM